MHIRILSCVLMPRNGIAIAVDHLDPGEVKNLADRVGDAHGRIDILLNDIWGPRC
jgi:NAD(P)-dependent dehydrogenase (short-subunit alcohol dehydrogenase family)